MKTDPAESQAPAPPGTPSPHHGNDGTSSRRPGLVLLCLLSALLLAKFAVVLWSLDKGFDITDEGWYMLSYTFPHEDRFPLHEFHTLLTSFLPVSEWTVVKARIVRLCIELPSLWIFAWGLSVWTRSRYSRFRNCRTSTLAIFLFAGLGLYLSLFSRAVSYYDLTQATLLVSTGLTLAVLARRSSMPSDVPNAMILMCIAGACIGLQFFVKFPAAVLQFLTVAALLRYGLKHNRYQYRVATCALLVGMVFAAILFLAFTGQSVVGWLQRFQGGLHLFSYLGYDVVGLIRRIYIPDAMAMMSYLLPSIGVAWVVRVGLDRALAAVQDLDQAVRRRDIIHTSASLSGILAFAIIASMDNEPGFVYLTYDGVHSGWIYSVYVYALALVCLLFIVVPGFRRVDSGADTRRDDSAVIAWLVLLPIFMMVGSDTVFSVSLYAHLVPWFAAVYLLAAGASRQLRLRRSAMMLVAAVVLLSQAHFFWNYLLRPYRLHAGLHQQTEEIDGADGLKFDPLTAKFIGDVRQQLWENGYLEGDPIIALWELPGLVYLMKGYSPATPWYFRDDPDYRYATYHLRSLRGRTFHRPPWLILAEPLDDRLRYGLLDAGIGYPAEYRLVGKAWNPHTDVTYCLLAPK